MDVLVIGAEYEHVKSGGVYTLLGFGRFQWDQVWHDACLYQCGAGHIYMRQVSDFCKKFIEVE